MFVLLVGEVVGLGNARLDFMRSLAEPGGRTAAVDFNSWLATAFEKDGPDNHRLDFKSDVVGPGGRTAALDFSAIMATAKEVAGHSCTGFHALRGPAGADTMIADFMVELVGAFEKKRARHNGARFQRVTGRAPRSHSSGGFQP